MALHDLAVCLVATCGYVWKTLSMFDNLEQANRFDYTIQANIQSVWLYVDILTKVTCVNLLEQVLSLACG